MSQVFCGHECICDCEIHNPGSGIVHCAPCCEGRCPRCRSFILTGMKKAHLMKCHQMSEAEAIEAIANI